MRKQIIKRVLKSFWVIIFLSACHFAQAQEEIDSIGLEKNNYFDSVDKRDLKSIQERTIPDSILQLLQRDEAFWYANAQPQKKVASKKAPSLFIKLLQQGWLRNVLWVLIVGAFVAVLIWYLTSLNIRLFRSHATAINHSSTDVLPDDIFSIAYDKAIDKALQLSNYRLAVRLQYLQALTLMANKNIIQYGQDRTNTNYLQQLYGTDYYHSFFALTRRFEYTWYGQFPVAPAAYESITKEFTQFKQRLPL